MIFYGDMEKIRQLCEIRYDSWVAPSNMPQTKDGIDGETIHIDSGLSRAISTTVRLSTYELYIESKTEQHVVLTHAPVLGFVEVSKKVTDFLKEKTITTDCNFGQTLVEWWEFWKSPVCMARDRTYIGKTSIEKQARYKRHEVDWFNIDNPLEFNSAICRLWTEPRLDDGTSQRAA